MCGEGELALSMPSGTVKIFRQLLSWAFVNTNIAKLDTHAIA